MRETRKCITCPTTFEVFNKLQTRCKYCQARYKNRRPKRYTKPCNRCGEQYHPRDTKSKTCASCKVAFPCKVCGEISPRTGDGQTHCSSRCRELSQLAGKHGSINFIKAIQRDKFTCRRCGVTGVVSVHHIDGKGLGYPKPERNSGMENLVTLCNNCHVGIHAATNRALYALHPDTVLKEFHRFIQAAPSQQFQ